MWGVVPAAGLGSRIQPLACSKELLPLGGQQRDGHPRAVSEYLLDRMTLAGATRIAMVIAPSKVDLVSYHGTGSEAAPVSYVVQPRPVGLCDAIFRALPLIGPAEAVLVGLPDTLWFPERGLALLGGDDLSFLCFPVDHPERFDAVVTGEDGAVIAVEVKASAPRSRWVWGAFKVQGGVLRELFDLWCDRGREDVYLGTLVNAWIARGGRATAVHAGEVYVDVGTFEGYRDALRLLADRGDPVAALRTDRGADAHGSGGGSPSGSPARDATKEGAAGRASGRLRRRTRRIRDLRRRLLRRRSAGDGAETQPIAAE